MENKKYTLDRIEESILVFLEYPEELNELLINRNEVQVEVAVGDIVEISKLELGFKITILNAETEDMLEKVSNMLEKLKNKNKSN